MIILSSYIFQLCLDIIQMGNYNEGDAFFDQTIMFYHMNLNNILILNLDDV